MTLSTRQFLLVMVALCFGFPSRLGADSKSSPVPPPSGGPKSEFVDDPGFGLDPFFPASTRRPKVVVKNPDIEPPRATVPDSVVLKGITTFQGRKLAIINNYPLGEGEEFTLKGASPLRVKCVEIKEKSVV